MAKYQFVNVQSKALMKFVKNNFQEKVKNIDLIQLQN